jgi:hypothetical protein
MANRNAYYFLVPTWDIPPNGPLKLGSVIGSPKTVESPLYTASPKEGFLATEKN